MTPPNLITCPGSRLPSKVTGPLYGCPYCVAVFMAAPGERPETIPDHAQRSRASAPYVPRVADYLRDPLLHAFAQARVPEEVVIDALAVRVRDLEEQCMRLSMLRADPLKIVLDKDGAS